MKLTKEQTNELLYAIETEDEEMGLIFRLIYIYGRTTKEVLHLQTKDINLENETITFHTKIKTIIFPLHKDVSQGLINIIIENNLKKNDNIFKYTNYQARLQEINKFLKSYTKHFNEYVDFEVPILTTKDLKNLRGQHLFMDGVDIHTIQDFYHHSRLQVVKENIDYYNLKEEFYVCTDVDEIFSDLTDTNIFWDTTFDDDDLVTVTKRGKTVIIRLDYAEETVTIIKCFADDDLKDVIENYDHKILLEELKGLKKPGHYKIIDDMEFHKG